MAIEFSLSFIYRLTKDLIGFITKNKSINASEKVKRRIKLKKLFEEKLHGRKLTEVIIRDVNRLEKYPDIHKEKGISSWFKSEAVGTYARKNSGIELCLSGYSLKKELSINKFVYAELPNKTGDEFTCFLLGRIPFDKVIDVDWDGDEYYPIPHIYCDFGSKRGLYEEMVFAI